MNLGDTVTITATVVGFGCDAVHVEPGFAVPGPAYVDVAFPGGGTGRVLCPELAIDLLTS